MESIKLTDYENQPEARQEQDTHQTAENQHLEYWKKVAETRQEIGAIALRNHDRVHELRERFYAHRLSDQEIIEFGLSFGAQNDMQGGQEDLQQLFARLYQNNQNIMDADFYRGLCSTESLYGLMMRHPAYEQLSTMKLFHAAQFLHESAELEVSTSEEEVLLYGAADIYERIWQDESVGWSEAYKRQALLHWHGVMSRLLAQDLARPDLSEEKREEIDEHFKEVQMRTIDMTREFAQIENAPKDRDTYRSDYRVRNGELFEIFTQVGGWYLIREEELFGDFEIRPAKERSNRPQDGITGTKLRKYAHDAVVVHHAEDGSRATRMQLKACPEQKGWESKYVREIPVVRIKHISEDKLRKRLLKSMRQIAGHYRAPKKRAKNQLRAHVRELFAEDLFQEAA